MPRALLWLVPVVSEDPLILGADRFPLEPEVQGTAFRERLAPWLGPKLLPLVKGRILPGESDDTFCGAEEDPDLGSPDAIVFDGKPWSLSHCGRAFIDRLPQVREQAAALKAACQAGGWTAQERIWLERMVRSIELGYGLMLVKEEG